MKHPLLTIILPTYNESANVSPIMASIRKSLNPNIDYEVLFVDDSSDDTPSLIKAEMLNDHRVRLIHRSPEKRTGLATAFTDGFREARGGIYVAWIQICNIHQKQSQYYWRVQPILNQILLLQLGI